MTISDKEFERYLIKNLRDTSILTYQAAQMMLSSSTVTLAQIGACFTSAALNTWVINSEVSDYMTGNKNILSTMNSISSLFSVTLRNDSTCYTESVGIANATPSLSYVLYIPKFSFNLLFGSRLTKSLNCSMTLFPDHCVFQELKMQKTIGTGRESEDIYYLERF